MQTCPDCDVEGILADARASIERTVYAFRSPPAVPLMYQSYLDAKIAELRERQAALEGMYNQALLNPTGGFLIVGLVAGAASLIGIIGSWALKQRAEARTVEEQTAAYREMIAQGMDPKRAAELAYGTGGGIGGIMNKALLITAIIAGVVIFVKIA